MSNDVETVFLTSYWPSHKTPPRVTIELNVSSSPGSRLQYDYSATVTLCDGSHQGISGELEATSKDLANYKAMFKLVGLLGEMLADRIPEK